MSIFQEDIDSLSVYTEFTIFRKIPSLQIASQQMMQEERDTRIAEANKRKALADARAKVARSGK